MSSSETDTVDSDLLKQIQIDCRSLSSKPSETVLKRISEYPTTIEKLEATEDADRLAKMWFFLGEIQFQMEMDNQAIESFDKSLQFDSQYADAYASKGRTLLYMGSYDLSIECYEQAIALKADKAIYWFDLGMAYKGKANSEKVHECFVRVVTLSKELALHQQLQDSFYNMGMAALSKKDYVHALENFNKVIELTPNDLQTHGKIVQIYEFQDDKTKRDEKVQEIYTLYHEGKFGKEVKFCRDQFPVTASVEANGQNIHVFVYEHFELAGSMAVKYVFQCTDEQQKQTLFRISMGSYEFTNQIQKEQGLLRADERAYHLDGYYPGNLHKTFDFCTGNQNGPFKTYDELKAQVLNILTGNATVLSSSVFNN